VYKKIKKSEPFEYSDNILQIVQINAVLKFAGNSLVDQCCVMLSHVLYIHT
jgi:hypothetical protein